MTRRMLRHVAKRVQHGSGPSRTACAGPIRCGAPRTSRAGSTGPPARPGRTRDRCRAYRHVAVSAVASRRSRVSGSVVYSSRGNPVKAESRGLHDHEVGDAGGDGDRSAVGLDRRGPRSGSRLDERLAVLALAARHAAPPVLGQLDPDPGQPGVAGEEVIGQTQREGFRLADRFVARPARTPYSSWCRSAAPRCCRRRCTTRRSPLRT